MNALEKLKQIVNTKPDNSLDGKRLQRVVNGSDRNDPIHDRYVNRGNDQTHECWMNSGNDPVHNAYMRDNQYKAILSKPPEYKQ